MPACEDRSYVYYQLNKRETNPLLARKKGNEAKPQCSEVSNHSNNKN